MPYIGPMNQAQILRDIHTLFSNGTDYPAAGEEDYDVRVALINSFIRVWSRTPGVKWRELFDVDATGTIVASGDITLNCNVRFRRLAGKVKLILNGATMDVPVLSQERLDDDDLPVTYCYLAGTTGARTLNLVGVPDSQVGATVRYRFYRYAKTLVNEADIPDMADPNFLIFSVVSRLFQLSRNNTSYTVYFSDARESLDSMETENLENEISEDTDNISDRIHNIGIMGQ